MTIILLEDVRNTLTEISDFIDSVNIEEAGERWIDKFLLFIESFSASSGNVTYALCRDEYLASHSFSCFNYNDWIVAFTIEEQQFFVVHKIIRGSVMI